MDTIYPSVLFVDAELSILESIKRMLIENEKVGYFASSIEEAEKIVSEQSIDIMFVDITSGNLVELLEKIQISNPDIVKVVISDFSHLSKVINSVRRFNLHSFILKPWKKDELLEALAQAEDYSTYVKAQINEKENLKQKNVIYQRIINFKDDVGEASKIDIAALKNALFLEVREYEKVFDDENSKDKDIKLKNISNAIEMFSSNFPTFVEKFTIEELISSWAMDGIVITSDKKESSFIKNLTLIRELIARFNKFIRATYQVEEVHMHVYPENGLLLNIEFKCNEDRHDNIKMFLDFLGALLKNVQSSLEYEIDNNHILCKFKF